MPRGCPPGRPFAGLPLGDWNTAYCRPLMRPRRDSPTKRLIACQSKEPGSGARAGKEAVDGHRGREGSAQHQLHYIICLPPGFRYEDFVAVTPCQEVIRGLRAARE
eukprot:scaffold171042_cov46-Prasinocladus_malaysianus.AAC.1